MILYQIGEEWTCLWNINFWFSVFKLDIYFTAGDCLAVGIWVEYIANYLTIGEGSVRNQLVLIRVSVSSCYEELSPLEDIQIVSHVSLFERVGPHLLSFSCLVYCSGHLENVWILVHVLPEWFPIFWVIASCICLLTAIVEERDTLSGEGECQCTLEHRCVWMAV